MSFGGKGTKSKTSERLPRLISTLIEEEKMIKEKYEMLTLAENAFTENVSNENVFNVKCEESKTAVKMEDIENVETKDSLEVDEEVSKENSKTERNGAGPKKDSEVETKIQELYSLLLQSGNEERLENFQKFVLNK